MHLYQERLDAAARVMAGQGLAGGAGILRCGRRPYSGACQLAALASWLVNAGTTCQVPWTMLSCSSDSTIARGSVTAVSVACGRRAATWLLPWMRYAVNCNLTCTQGRRPGSYFGSVRTI